MTTTAVRLTRLGELLISLSASPVPTHLFQTLADQAATVVPCDGLAVCLADPEERGYLAHSLSGDLPPLGARVFGLDEGLVGRAMHSGRPLVVADLGAEAGVAADLEGAWHAAGLRAGLVLPLRRGLERLGALVFAARRPGAYGEEDAQLGALIAAGVSAALESSRAYQALADERSTLAALLTSTQDAVLMVNPDGVILLANPACLGMLGRSPDDLTGRPVLDTLDHAPLRALFAEARPTVAEVPLPDGRVAQASLVPVTTPYGEAVGLAAVLRDITVLKDLERMKNDFVNTVSHDLKSPLTVIATTTELLRRAGANDPRHEQRCVRLQETTRLMSELVTDLLDLGRIEAGLEATEAVDLAVLVHEVAGAAAPDAEAKTITLAVEAPAEVPVRAGRGRLRQALANLVGNAVKYTPRGGRVDVALTVSATVPASAGRPARGPVAIVRIVDTGIGIPAKDLPFVFDKFFRVRAPATQDIPGTGLGLAIVRGVVETHGGAVWVESREGRGSTFAFTIPLIADA